jgi:telomerase reverse transcriptase
MRSNKPLASNIFRASGNGGQRCLLQTEGISQGSILSSMLCNIYFGNVEGILLDGVFDKTSLQVIRGGTSTDCDTLFAHANHKLHLLVQIVNDFLLISTSKLASIHFLEKLNKGIPSLGVKINPLKSQANSPISMENTSTGKMEAVQVCQNFFPWCRLLIDTRTCKVTLDFNHYPGLLATDAVAIHLMGNEGLNLKKKMQDFVRPRCCQKLLFSSCINGIDMVRLNFYQMLLLCAIKLIHYVNESDSRTALVTHQNLIYRSAVDTICYAYLLILSKILHGNGRTAKSWDEDAMAFQRAWQDAFLLGRHAFFHVF